MKHNTTNDEQAVRPSHCEGLLTGHPLPDYYIDAETGLLVFTEDYHLKRGYCCKSGCRHCPYSDSAQLQA